VGADGNWWIKLTNPKIYSDSASRAPAQTEKHLPSLPVQSPPSVVAYQAPAQETHQPIPDIAPMRRGRPSKSQATSSTPHSTATSRTRAAVPSPQVRPTTSDPFAALDKKALPQDELSNRFPSVEQFSLLHDSGNAFQFGEGRSPNLDQSSFDEKLAAKLAEDVFAATSPAPPKPELLKRPSGELLGQPQSISRGATGSGNYARPVLYEPQPTRPVMVSTGTMTSPSPSPSPPRYEYPPQSQALTTPPSSSTQDRGPDATIRQTAQQQPKRPVLLDIGRSATHAIPMSRQPSSSRPSLEMSRSASQTDIAEPMRSKSANAKPRPHSVFVESNLEFLRDLDSPSSQGTSTGGFPPIAGLQLQDTGRSVGSVQSEHIDSNVDFLRAMEAEADANKPEKRATSGFVAKHVKRASMPSISLPKPGVKNKLGGKFGDAFRRFERNAAGGASDPVRTPSPEGNQSPLGGAPDDGDHWEVSSQEIPPEVKRELEKRQLSQEEKRVAAAAAEYKRQLANRSEGEPARHTRNRANSIQKRVHALLNDTKDPPPKTAEGYGRYTAEPAPMPQPGAVNGSSRTGAATPKPESYRITQSSTGYRPSTPQEPPRIVQRTVEAARPGTAGIGVAPKIARKPVGSGGAPMPAPIVTQAGTGGRPPPPPKPNKLRTGGSTAPRSPASARRSEGDLLDAGRGDGATDEDWERSFAKRYPSLSGLEMVDTVVAGSSSRKV
jgi:AP2-associated kinase